MNGGGTREKNLGRRGRRRARGALCCARGDLGEIAGWRGKLGSALERLKKGEGRVASEGAREHGSSAVHACRRSGATWRGSTAGEATHWRLDATESHRRCAGAGGRAVAVLGTRSGRSVGRHWRADGAPRDGTTPHRVREVHEHQKTGKSERESPELPWLDQLQEVN